VSEARYPRQRVRYGNGRVVLWLNCRRNNKFKTPPNIRRQIPEVDLLDAIAITVSQLLNDEMPIACYREVHMIRDTISPHSHVQAIQHAIAFVV
jgi:hypothetical protein